MDNSAIRFRVGPEVLLPQCDPKEAQAGVGVEAQPDEDGVEEIVGEAEGKLGNGVEALEREDAAYPVDELRSGDAGIGRAGVDGPAASGQVQGEEET